MPSRGLPSQAALASLNQTLEDARKRTSVRIIPVITQSSGKYERAEDLVGLWAAALALALMFIFFTRLQVEDSSAAGVQSGGMGVFGVLLVIALGFIVGAAITTQIGFLRRLFVPRNQLAGNALTRATQAFQEECLRRNDNPHVLMFYVSIYEQAVHVLTSDEVQSRLGQQQIDSMTQTIQASLKAGEVHQGLAKAAALAAQQLAFDFPPQSMDFNRYIDHAQLAIIR